MDDTNTTESEKLYFLVRDSFIEQGVVFFGGFASTMYSKYMPKEQQLLLKRVPDFDVLAEDPQRTALIVKEKLLESGFKNVKTILHSEIGEIIPSNVEIVVNGETLAFVYQPVACHNYNKIKMGQSDVNVATIDTMLSFYLAFLYADKPYFNKDRILCMSKFLFDVQEKNRLEQKGVLKRFSINCYGKQPTLESMRAEKTEKFAELADKKGSEEYEMWFMKYSPITNDKHTNIRVRPQYGHSRSSKTATHGSPSTLILDRSMIYSKGAKTHKKLVSQRGSIRKPKQMFRKMRTTHKKYKRDIPRRKKNSFFNFGAS
jgi:hypothetical protein